MLDRREFIKLSAMAGMVLAGSSLAACASGSSANSGSSNTASSAAGSSSTASSTSSAAASTTSSASTASTTSSASAASGSHVLLVFFSRAGENYTDNGIEAIDVGHTEVLAGLIASRIACDTFKIVSEEQYPYSYEEMLDIAQSEQDADARPAIANISDLPSLENYSTILVGSPIWWGKPPMIMRTLLESSDFAGKTILPFTTSGGSGLGTAPSDYAALAPAATIGSGFTVLGVDAADAADDVASWAASAGLA